MPSPLHVVHFQRRPRPGYHSVERLFSDLRAAMPPHIRCSVPARRFPAAGVLPRLYDMLEAAGRQGDVNHITGDAHYLSYFLCGRRTLLTVLDCVGLHRPAGLRRLLLRVLWFELPLRRVHVVSAISEWTRQELARLLGWEGSAVRVVPCSVSPAFRPCPRPGLRKAPVVLQVGTGANKNIPRLAEALAGLRCELRIVGLLSDEQRAALARAGTSYTSSSELADGEMIRAYEEADIVSLVSTYEGFGLPIVEANAVGRAVVTSNCASMPEVAGGSACLVDPFDPRSIREGIRRVIDDDAYRGGLVEAGYANARRFEVSRIAALYADIYDELASATDRVSSRLTAPAPD